MVEDRPETADGVFVNGTLVRQNKVHRPKVENERLSPPADNAAFTAADRIIWSRACTVLSAGTLPLGPRLAQESWAFSNAPLIIGS